MVEGLKTMKQLQIQNDKNINNHLRVFLISLPIIVGLMIFLSSEIAFWASSVRTSKEGFFTTVVLSILFGGFYQIIPFLIIALIVRGFIRKGAGKTEIFIKLAFMLIPVSIMTAYWLFKYIDPFALGFLIYINGFLLLIGLLVGIFVCKIIKAR
jgi:hypothetical protein